MWPAIGRRAGLLLLLLALLSGQVAAGGKAVEMRPFVAGSLQQIVAAHAGKPFLLGFWSLDCVHCGDELALLQRLHKDHPNLALVLVATDGEMDWSGLQAHLQAAGLGQTEQWVFADAMPERLRQEIDRHWYGELPRTYLYGRDGRATAVSGVLSAKHLGPWLRQNPP
ncbi:MAG: TlpA family protein disulfide reductase [Betaproteobacteria bacterium]|nr:TlpA family protein disulfide reductase [Betaproteobacteria bacterium]